MLSYGLAHDDAGKKKEKKGCREWMRAPIELLKS
jgi:hypothetical protein